ncbi:MAG: HAD family hydrolase [Kiritimatiellae bacterium]|nr:HAD family hydrolase [Kiritimatiellia bacterium]
MREFSNYVFDFYGTLVDVRTDENKPALWRFMADFHGAHGCLFDPSDLRDAFWRFDAEEREAARRRSGWAHPEIRIERVFLRLLLETPARSCGVPVGGRPVREWRRLYARDPEAALDALRDGDWVAATANAFRILSRERLCPYPDTFPVLRELVRRGKRIYLLSNAQGVFTRPEIGAVGLDAFFPAPRISSEAGMMKPQREFLDGLMREEGLDPRETAFVGNEMRSDMALAVRCGVQGIFLNTGGMPEEALRAEVARLLADERAPAGAMPWLVSSGRLRDILPE